MDARAGSVSTFPRIHFQYGGVIFDTLSVRMLIPRNAVSAECGPINCSGTVVNSWRRHRRIRVAFVWTLRLWFNLA